MNVLILLTFKFIIVLYCARAMQLNVADNNPIVQYLKPKCGLSDSEI